MNVELLTNVRDRILLEPEKFCMSIWASSYPEAPDNFLVYNSYCTAALVIVVGMPKHKANSFTGYASTAERLLDITHAEARPLFFVSLWPEDLASRFYAAHGDHVARAKIAAEWIDRFIVQYNARFQKP